MSKKVFALVDCNNFYTSCERVFNPELEGKPLVVLSNNDGCVIARSDEAKLIGIRMGVPVFEVSDIISKHEVNVFSTNYTLYGDMSQRVMTILSLFSPGIEIYSIDEAFIEFTGIKQEDQKGFGIEIRQIIGKWTGLPVSIGIAPTKTLSKIANHIVKKNQLKEGVLVFNQAEEYDKNLRDTPVGEIWGIGERYKDFLLSNGIITALDLKNADDKWIRKHMHVVGQRIVMELRGISCLNLESLIQEKKDICTSRSYGQSLTHYEDVEQATTSFAASCAEKLRRQASCARIITVFLMTNKFAKGPRYVNFKMVELNVASNSTPEIIGAAVKALKQVYREGYKYKKSGVIVSELVPEKQVQYHLWQTAGNKKTRELMKIIDNINAKTGRGRIRYAVEGRDKKWQMRQERLSQKYTTNWDELLTINLNKEK